MGVEVFYTAEQLAERVKVLGAEIAKFYQDRPLTVIALANGGVFFGCDLVRAMDIPLWFDVAAVSSYRNDVKCGEPYFRCEVKLSPVGREILIVDDVLDSGDTIRFCKEYFLKAGAAGVRSAVLIDKKLPGRKAAADWSCFDAPDLYLVGAGMDSREYYRNYPGVGVLR